MSKCVFAVFIYYVIIIDKLLNVFFYLISYRTLFPLYCRKELGLMMYKLSDLDPTMRPTQFTVEDVDRLTTAYKYLMEKHPEISLYNYNSSRHLLSLSNTKDIVVQECTELLEETSI